MRLDSWRVAKRLSRTGMADGGSPDDRTPPVPLWNRECLRGDDARTLVRLVARYRHTAAARVLSPVDAVRTPPRSWPASIGRPPGSVHRGLLQEPRAPRA